MLRVFDFWDILNLGHPFLENLLLFPLRIDYTFVLILHVVSRDQVMLSHGINNVVIWEMNWKEQP